MVKTYTTVVEIQGKFFPFVLTHSTINNRNVVKKVEGESERKWFWACMAAEALNNL